MKSCHDFFVVWKAVTIFRKWRGTFVNEYFVDLFSEEQARLLAASVSVDKTDYSVSFNEFLKLMSMQNQSEPDEETLVDMFQ